MHFAHSRRDKDDPRPWQELSEHLVAVANRAASFAFPAWRELARTAGLWHDCGKYQSAFQDYIKTDSEASNETSSRVPHSVVGAALAYERLGETESGIALGLVIEAHHGALKTVGQFYSTVTERGKRFLHDARAGGLPLDLESSQPECPAPLSALAVRMLFSALIDADLLDTEAWDLQRERSNETDPLCVLLERLDSACRTKILQAAKDAISEKEKALASMRKHVYEACVIAGETFPAKGQFTLTVPTGGGKTLSGIAFALHYAVRNGKQRVIVVAPYTSILEQTADVYRTIFGAHNIVEHHSSIVPTVDTDRNRQASENWDAPVIVTTSVQLLESLHAAHKRPCRKLHRIANSVVLLDEVQTFPTELLKPIHVMLQRLVDEFDVTVVHGTATQPLLGRELSKPSRQRAAIQLDSREIIPSPAALFDAVRSRFCLEILGDLTCPLDPQVLVEDVLQQRSALVITHRRDDARMIADMLGVNCLHLSAAMCAAHRSDVLAEARRRLNCGEPCLLVATQLIEAGVDIDFPVVYRAMAGLETLAQAAGRCNRAMKLPQPGRFVVYCAGTPGLDDEPIKESNPPQGTPRLGKQVAEQFFAKGIPDLNDPSLFPRYTARVLPLRDLDAYAIESDEASFNFPAVAEKFRMIDEALTSVIVPYGDAPILLAALKTQGPSRERYRALQRYVIGIRDNKLKELLSSGWLETISESGKDDALWCVRGGELSPYDPQFGLAGKSSQIKLPALFG